MPPNKNPLKLNNLQLRTLALLQAMAEDEALARRDEAAGEVVLLHVPHPHGDHLHIGRFVVSTRDASGLGNPSVWKALERKGLVRAGGPSGVILTAAGVGYHTGLGRAFLPPSDH